MLNCLGELGTLKKFHELSSQPQGTRTPQNLMTNNPDKVWPKGIVPYLLHESLSEYARTCL